MELEVWSDIACPWCYVGKRRLEAALAGFARRDEINVTWRSFELDPSAPRERAGDGASHLAAKYRVSHEEALAMQQTMTRVAAEEGLDFRFDLARGGNTFDAHRLLHLAAERGSQDVLKERLLLGYLSQGEVIGDPQVLLRLALEAGLSERAVREVLRTDRFATAVRDDEREAALLGCTGVPFFVVDRAFGVSGAQSPEVLGALLARALLTANVAGDPESCRVDGC